MLICCRGYKVRGTVRSQEKADRLKQKYAQYKDQIEVVIVDDVARAGALDEAAKGVQYLHHIASPFHLKLVDAYVSSHSTTTFTMPFPQ